MKCLSVNELSQMLKESLKIALNEANNDVCQWHLRLPDGSEVTFTGTTKQMKAILYQSAKSMLTNGIWNQEQFEAYCEKKHIVIPKPKRVTPQRKKVKGEKNNDTPAFEAIRKYFTNKGKNEINDYFRQALYQFEFAYDNPGKLAAGGAEMMHYIESNSELRTLFCSILRDLKNIRWHYENSPHDKACLEDMLKYLQDLRMNGGNLVNDIINHPYIKKNKSPFFLGGQAHCPAFKQSLSNFRKGFREGILDEVINQVQKEIENPNGDPLSPQWIRGKMVAESVIDNAITKAIRNIKKGY